MKDGLYIVSRGTINAAFVVRDGEVTSCAPILRDRIEYWKKVATYVPSNLDVPPLEKDLVDVSPGE